MRRWSILIAAAVAIAGITGCTGTSEPRESDSDSTSAASNPSTGDDYVLRVNALCRALVAESIAVRGGAELSLESYLDLKSERVRLRATFDDEVESIPVAHSDQVAADLFDAYRAWSDDAEAKIAAAAETGDSATFEAAVDEYGEAVAATTWKRDLAAVGISCPAR